MSALQEEGLYDMFVESYHYTQGETQKGEYQKQSVQLRHVLYLL